MFEIECVDAVNKNSVLCGGGRYNNLIENLGGPKTPAVGFGMGTERLLEVLSENNLGFNLDDSLDCYVIPVSDNEKCEALTLCHALRLMGFKSDVDNMNRNVKNNFKQAEKLNTKFAIVIGEEELKEGYYTVKNMKSKTNEEVNTKLIIDYLMEKLSEDDDCCDDNYDCNCSCGENCDCDDECNCGDDCHCKK